MTGSDHNALLSDAFFRTLLESAPDAMVIVDDSGRIVLINGQTEQMFQYGRDELLGKSVELLLPQRLREVHKQHRATYAREPRLRRMGVGLELTALRRDGSEFAVEISLSPLDTPDGMLVSSVIRDVTERKEMEQQIIAARQAAERANKANSAFLAAASHDLRQPVQALSLLNGALRRTVKDERALQMIEQRIHEHSLTAMTNLLNSLLDISRLDAGAVTPELERFPMQRLIDRLSAEFGRQAHHKGLEFSAASCDALVESDPNLLAEIIQNLVSNAIRYTDEGQVQLGCDIEGGLCHLRIADTGIGIEPQHLDDIFQEFVQCRSPGGAKEGFGLGLAIVRRLADLLAHDVTVESTPGRGSTFSISVPVVNAGDTTAHERPAKRDEASGSAGGLVLLVEDDVSVANAWTLLLEAEGYRVATAATASEAAAIAAHVDTKPALLISDFHLADKSTGVEAVDAVRTQFGSPIPAFIVSGDTSKVVEDARRLDNCTLMSKPVDTDRLLAAASRAITSGVVPQD
ncbi:MAG: PAS domain S-box protein [Woeseiaceae bacterium]|nr:PAS domain S-box protein [Woeseiaceae bacterium]